MNKLHNSPKNQLEWLDLIKAIALIWIFINHLGEHVFGAPYFANPTSDWSSLGVRVTQLAPLNDFGSYNILVNIFRYVAWTGDHGVQLFLIASGFGLSWGLLSRAKGNNLELKSFFLKRLLRIYPLWWGAHILFVLATFIAGWQGWGLHLTDLQFYLSFVGFRLTPELLYFFSPAWWFFGLLLQLYLVFPFLWWILQKIGTVRFLIISLIVSLTIRGIGLFFFTGFLDAWSRGAIFITRMPEFVFGISLAIWYYNDSEGVLKFIRRPLILVLSVTTILVGFVLSFTLFGMIFSFLLIGVGVFAILFALFTISKDSSPKISGFGSWLGKHSYSIYLIHHPIILVLMPSDLQASPVRWVVSLLLVIFLVLILSIGLEQSADGILKIFGNWYKNKGLFPTLIRIASIPVTIYFILIAGELIIQWVYPLEVIGWGERPALEPDPVLGYRMKPSSVTRLRWESYDYKVITNSLGFPGPEYSASKDINTIRIMTVGDAFTSAEGVDTENAWPRLLEKKLSTKTNNYKFEVLNFGVTGYGPNQYSLLVEQYAPIYTPDIIIIGFFVNDYQDARVSSQEFQNSVGFGLPSPTSLYVTSRLMHLRYFLDKRVVEKISHTVKGEIDYYGYFLGNFSSLERGHPEIEIEGKKLVFKQIESIKNIADQLGADVYILMIPAPVQICDSDELDYYPEGVDLADPLTFDIDLPQRMTKDLADALDIIYIDLGDQLKSLNECPYQPRNMHWTYSGHKAVADYITQEVQASFTK